MPIMLPVIVKRAQLKDDVWKYPEEEDAIDYILFRIVEVTVKVY
jgi:hypothetical protein